MGIMKRFAEEVSEAMGLGGEITKDVLLVGDKALDLMAKYRWQKEQAIKSVVDSYFAITR